MQVYETTIVIDSLQKAEDMQTTVTKIENFIKNNGGSIIKKEEWGKKRLAYEINKKQYGTYFHIIFEGASRIPSLLERECGLEETILRYLTIKTEARHLDKISQGANEAKKGSAVKEEASPAAPIVEETPKEEVVEEATESVVETTESEEDNSSKE